MDPPQPTTISPSNQVPTNAADSIALSVKSSERKRKAPEKFQQEILSLPSPVKRQPPQSPQEIPIDKCGNCNHTFSCEEEALLYIQDGEEKVPILRALQGLFSQSEAGRELLPVPVCVNCGDKIALLWRVSSEIKALMAEGSYLMVRCREVEERWRKRVGRMAKNEREPEVIVSAGTDHLVGEEEGEGTDEESDSEGKDADQDFEESLEVSEEEEEDVDVVKNGAKRKRRKVGESWRTKLKKSKGKRPTKETDTSASSIESSRYPLGKGYICSGCDKEFQLANDLKSHFSESHPELTQPEVSNENEATDTNQNTRLNAAPFKCGTCGVACRKVEELRVHHAEAHPVRKWSRKSEKRICECGMVFYRKDHYECHVRVHTGEKPFSCDKCDKRFSSQRSLSNHLETHTDQRDYCCSMCGRRFKRLGHLKDHEKTHMDAVRPFACNVCKKEFKIKKHLNTHMVTHLGTKDHVCQYCSRAFSRRDNLLHHIRIMHEHQTQSPGKKKSQVIVNSNEEETSVVAATISPAIVNSSSGVSVSTTVIIQSVPTEGIALGEVVYLDL